MLFIIYLLLFINIVTCSNVGSTIFYKRLGSTECWSEEDIAKLRARKIFENIIPPSVTSDKVNPEYIKETLKYFKYALKTVENDVDKKTGVLLKKVLADTIGAHLKSQILPSARLAYYAGYIPYRNVRELHDFFDQIKIFLNTQGLGWRSSRSVPQWTNLTVEKIRIGTGNKFIDPCTRLVTKCDSKSCIHIPAPKSDDSFRPSSIALPLKFGGLVNLVSPVSENVLLKYYTTASRCILNNSPNTCRHLDFVTFNNELWHWMKRDVAPRLVDERLYAAYGGVLRVAAAVQRYGKGLSRRNIFEFQDAGVSKWHPWKALKESYLYVNTDWTPHLYVAVVLLIGVAICLLQICYTYILGDDDVCNCKGPNRSTGSKEIAYANIDSNIPAMLPSHQSAVYYSDHKRAKIMSTSKTKTSSLGSLKTQKVYDLHENTEKLMAVIMSDNENTSDGSLTHSQSSHKSNKNIKICHTENLKSPPKIDTPITQIKIERKRPKNQYQTPMYSTSTVTNSEVTYLGPQVTDSLSGTGSSTSARTASDTSSKSRCRRSRSSRDLAWARRVVSKHSMQKTTSGTERDVTSYTTPKSHRHTETSPKISEIKHLE